MLFASSEKDGLATLLLIRRIRLNGSYSSDAGIGAEHVAGGVRDLGTDLLLINCAAFFSTGVSRDSDTGRLMGAAIDGKVVDVPNAHI